MKFREGDMVKVIEAPSYLMEGEVLGASGNDTVFVHFDVEIDADLLYHPKRIKEIHELAKRDNLHCSFCNKSQAEVAKLVAGSGVYICDECVSICVEIVTDSLPPAEIPKKTSRRTKKAKIDG